MSIQLPNSSGALPFIMQNASYRYSANYANGFDGFPTRLAGNEMTSSECVDNIDVFEPISIVRLIE